MPKRKASTKKVTEVNIPKAVKAQGDAADKLLADQAEPEPKADVIVDKIEDDPVVPDKKSDPKPEQKVDDPAPKVDDPEPKVDQLPDDKTDWKHKYDVLQGMYNKGQEDVKNLSDTVANLQTMVNQQSTLLQQQSKAEPAPVAAEPEIGIEKLDEADFVGYGEEMRLLAQQHNQLIDINKQLMARIGQTPAGDETRLNRIESIVNETAQDRYTKALDLDIPDWRRIVNDSTFTGWLQGVDPASNYRWKDMMDSAYANLNHQQVSAILKRYAFDTGIDIGQATVQDAPVSPGPTNIADETVVDPLAGQAMPDETTGGDQGKAPEAYPTAEDVKRASALYAQNKISMKRFTEISNGFQIGLAAKRKAPNA